MKAIIIDDEIKSCEGLKSLIHEYCQDVVVVAMCQTVTDGVQAINMNKPDIVFLDIQMKGETGFDLLQLMPKPYTFNIIFATAYSDYAIKAFRFSAVDYLLKPIDVDDLKRAIEKAANLVNQNITTRLEQMLENLKPITPQQYKLAIPTSDGLIFIKISEIIYCQASDNYTYFHMSNGKKYLVSRTLKEYEDLLHEHQFFRIHNSSLINLNAIKRYIRGEGGQVVMADDSVLDVSKRKKEFFLKHISS